MTHFVQPLPQNTDVLNINATTIGMHGSHDEQVDQLRQMFVNRGAKDATKKQGEEIYHGDREAFCIKG